MALLAGHRLTVVDVETTGWSATEGHEIIEIARVVVDDGAITETWSSLVRPERPVPAESTRVHGITQEMLDQAAAPREIAQSFHDACGDQPLVFHNAAFDLSFVNTFLRRAGRRLRARRPRSTHRVRSAVTEVYQGEFSHEEFEVPGCGGNRHCAGWYGM